MTWTGDERRSRPACTNEALACIAEIEARLSPRIDEVARQVAALTAQTAAIASVLGLTPDDARSITAAIEARAVIERDRQHTEVVKTDIMRALLGASITVIGVLTYWAVKIFAAHQEFLK